MWAGVGKSGSPAPNPMTCSPAAWSALALASTARVAEGATAAARLEMRRSSVGDGVVVTGAMISYVPDTPDITIPASLLPADGRFGSGPSKVRPEQIAALAEVAGDLPRHQPPPEDGQVAGGSGASAASRTLFSLPDGYEVVLGQRRHHLLLGRRHLRPDRGPEPAPQLRRVLLQVRLLRARPRPHLKDPQIIESPVGTHPLPVADASVDLYALTHNETSTGVSMSIRRPKGAALPADGGGLVAVDATSGAGGLRVDAAEFDAYYLAPQKCFAGDGGLWIALMSPAALERVERIAASGRWIPTFLDLKTAVDNSVLDQTYNTPALATIFLLAEQLDWMNSNGGLEFTASPLRQVGRDPLHLGRAVRLRPTLRGEPAGPQPRGGHHRLRRCHRCGRRSPPCCGPTASSTPSPTASSAATSSGSPCSRPSSRTTSPRCAPASTYVVGALAWLTSGQRKPDRGQQLLALVPQPPRRQHRCGRWRLMWPGLRADPVHARSCLRPRARWPGRSTSWLPAGGADLEGSNQLCRCAMKPVGRRPCRSRCAPLPDARRWP